MMLKLEFFPRVLSKIVAPPPSQGQVHPGDPGLATGWANGALAPGREVASSRLKIVQKASAVFDIF